MKKKWNYHEQTGTPWEANAQEKNARPPYRYTYIFLQNRGRINEKQTYHLLPDGDLPNIK